MRELSKSIPRRIQDPYFMNRYFVGNGVDIGGLPDPLVIYKGLFPKLESVLTWDWDQGDAQFMESVEDETYDFVHSSHCLEHLVDPVEGLENWLRILKPGGYLIVMIPEEDLYEQGIFPSTFNKDHKWTYSINKQKSWSPSAKNLIIMIQELGEGAELVKLQKLDIYNNYNWPRYDQTRMPNTESGIEFVLRKRKTQEIIDKVNSHIQPNQSKSFPPELVPYLNQYKLDQASLREGNRKKAPFTDKSNPDDQ